jgi:ADP-ribose pyrophosphatase YjhB (NUDIX family)
MEEVEMQWLRWSQHIQAIAQTGLAYARDPFDLERYQKLRDLAVQIAAAHLERPEDAVRAVLAAEQGYPTPKVDVRAVVFREGRVLLVREAADGRWSLPGGWADIGESPAQVATREVLEETGYQVRAAKVLAVYDKARHEHPPSMLYVYKLFFRCELIGGEARTSHETEAVGFFGREAIPPLSTGRVTTAQIRRMFEHHDREDLPADFD